MEYETKSGKVQYNSDFRRCYPAAWNVVMLTWFCYRWVKKRARRGQKNEDSEGEIMMLCIHLSFALLYFYDNACCRKYKSRKLNFLRLKENTVHYKTEREHCPLLGTSWGSHPTNGLQKIPFSVQNYFTWREFVGFKFWSMVPISHPIWSLFFSSEALSSNSILCSVHTSHIISD